MIFYAVVENRFHLFIVHIARVNTKQMVKDNMTFDRTSFVSTSIDELHVMSYILRSISKDQSNGSHSRDRRNHLTQLLHYLG